MRDLDIYSCVPHTRRYRKGQNFWPDPEEKPIKVLKSTTTHLRGDE